MSWYGALANLGGKVPSVPSLEKPVEPLQATSDAEVPSVPPVPSEKSKSQGNTRSEAPREGGTDEKVKMRTYPIPYFGWNQWNLTIPLTDTELAALITATAHPVGLSPADVWAFLSLEDLQTLRLAIPEEIEALRAFVESRARTGDRTRAGHDLPFPAGESASNSWNPVCCGDCLHFQPDRIGDGSGIGDCKAGIQPSGGLMYPRVERLCQAFAQNI